MSHVRLVTAAAAVCVLAGTGLGWGVVHGATSGITISDALGHDAARSTDGDVNVLLIGLDSRKDQDGNDLPQPLLDQLHAGDSSDGGYNTNTLILVHLSADDHLTAFSIPRDDYVPLSGVQGYDHVKIKEAYGLTKAAAEQRLVDSGDTDPRDLERQGREAGRAATLKVVHDLTGVPIDYFAEVTLAGFYDLTGALGGVQVCLNAPAHDDFSGADFPAGVQTLDASQAVAFVRQRHGLTEGDLDRTRRQQAFLASALHQLHADGSLTDMSRVGKLLDVVRRDVVLSDGWDPNLLRRLDAAASDVEFRTLPVVRFDTVDGQDVNIVDVAAIKAEVSDAFSGRGDASAGGGSAAAGDAGDSGPVIVDVVNAGDVSGMAAHVSASLTAVGYQPGEVRTANNSDPQQTSVVAAPDGATRARHLAALLDIDDVTQDQDVAPGHVRVTLGNGYDFPNGLDDAAAAHEQPPTVTSTAVAGRSQTVVGGGTPCVD